MHCGEAKIYSVLRVLHDQTKRNYCVVCIHDSKSKKGQPKKRHCIMSTIISNNGKKDTPTKPVLYKSIPIFHDLTEAAKTALILFTHLFDNLNPSPLDVQPCADSKATFLSPQ
eukprot:TRINITY_DN2685_c0_g1_i1.p3 TRINITY_DN2685_c0_g1~~TRINITY_DN2685_c0_g1_i1.p3  ORF type:complete len:113 (-),score=12.41 TRINITY_DN2685_c0_g1_i1:339-677(-)